MAHGLALVPRNPLQRDVMILGVGFNPANVVGGASAEHRFGNDRFMKYVVEELHHMGLGAEKVQVAIKHDAIKAVINELNPRGEKLNKELHRRSPPGCVARCRGLLTTADAIGKHLGVKRPMPSGKSTTADSAEGPTQDI